MRCNFLHLMFLHLFITAAFAQAQQPNTYYVYDGTSLRLVYDNPAHANYRPWQFWLYEGPVHISRYAAGLPYSRWGLIEGRSAENVMKQLKASQGFEEAYVNFFGPGTWGRYTFFNPVGPIAITDQGAEKKAPAQRYQLSQLNYRLNRVIGTVQSSLENNESEGPGSPVKEYFDQIKESVKQVSKLYSQLDSIRPQLHFIENGIVRTRTVVAQAENNMSKITAVLPSVKLPTSHAWMSHTEWAGSDGTIQVAVTEAGSAVSVQQTWTGGDGSMTGTVIVTIIPYEDIGSVEVEPPTRSGDNKWTVRVQSAGRSFPQTMTSPEHKTARRMRAVNYTTTAHSMYFVFSNSDEAHDAYAYFLYHKQLGR